MVHDELDLLANTRSTSDGLFVCEHLNQDTLDGLGQIVGMVIGGNDDRNSGHLGSTLLA